MAALVTHAPAGANGFPHSARRPAGCAGGNLWPPDHRRDGKPIADSISEVKKSALDARHQAEAGEAYLKPQPIPGLPAQIIYESIGPIFSVQPWNLPFWQVLRFFNTAALVGNTAIVKHAETVQGSAEALEAVVRDAGGPDGLYVNLAIQVKESAAVIADPRVRAATVTGSVRAGRAVAAEAGDGRRPHARIGDDGRARFDL